jgi:hypothetical protein
MNCNQIRMLLPSFENDELSEQERTMVYLHLAGCDGCRSALEDIGTLHSRLALLHTTSINTEILDGIISRLKRMKDTNASETVVDPMDIASSHITNGRETNKDILNEQNAMEMPRDSDGNLIPGWDFPAKP